MELQRRHIEKGQTAFPKMIAHLQSQPTLRSALKIVIDGAVAEHRVNPRLHKVFTEELPRSTRRLHGEKDERLMERLAAILDPYAIHVPNMEIALFLFRVVTHAAIHEAASERPDLLSNPLFSDELVTLIERYLVRSERTGKPFTRLKGKQVQK